MAQLGTEGTTRKNSGMAYEEGLDLISSGLEILSNNDKALEKLGGKRLVDYAARLNAQVNALDKLLTPAKNRIKADAIQNHKEELLGVNYKAVISQIEKSFQKTAELKAFLGTKIAQFYGIRTEVQVAFEVRE